jgi:signal transduction histidine kinase
MRRMVAVLRPDPETAPAVRSPQPSITDLEHLVSEERRNGMAVELRRCGEPRSVPAGVGVTVYRVAQEALTNARKHSPGGATTVVVDWAPLAVWVEVTNGPSTQARSPLAASGGGHGLVGMRERVASCGGELVTGPLPGGGWSVAARVPLPAGADTVASTS